MSTQYVIVIVVDQMAHPVIPLLENVFAFQTSLEEDVLNVQMAIMAMVAHWDVCPVTVILKVLKAFSVTALVSVSAKLV